MPMARSKKARGDDSATGMPADSMAADHVIPSFQHDRRRRAIAPMRTTPESRRPMLAAAGVLVVLACAAAGADVALHVDHRGQYLAVAAVIPQGAVLVPADLSIVSLDTARGLAAIPAAQSGLVLGRRATEPLAPGNLLTPSDVTGSVPLPDTESLVGASLSADQAPQGLEVGDSVLVVLSGSASLTSGIASSSSGLSGTESPTSPTSPTSPASPAQSSSSPGQAQSLVLATGTVYALWSAATSSQAGSSNQELVTLEVPKSAAPAVTAASAAGDVSLAQIASAALSPSSPASQSKPSTEPNS